MLENWPPILQRGPLQTEGNSLLDQLPSEPWMLVALLQVLASRLAPQIFEHECLRALLPQ